MVTSYRHGLEHKSDIQQHLGLLNGLAMQCERVVEFGFRKGISTAALCAGGCEVISYDIEPCEPHVSRLKKEYPNLTFIRDSSLVVTIKECDMLFIDSEHVADHLTKELLRHHRQVRRWIVMHDTEKFAERDYYGEFPGLRHAIEHFLASFGDQWIEMLYLPNCNGLTILERDSGP